MKKNIFFIAVIIGIPILLSQQLKTEKIEVKESTMTIKESINRLFLDTLLLYRTRLDSSRLRCIKSTRSLKRVTKQLKQQDSILSVIN